MGVQLGGSSQDDLHLGGGESILIARRLGVVVHLGLPVSSGRGDDPRGILEI
jgi:hypothetical protein